MEITKDVLEFRIAGMTQQLGKVLEETAQLQGALKMGNDLLGYLALVEAEPPEPPETPASDDGAYPLNEE